MEYDKGIEKYIRVTAQRYAWRTAPLMDAEELEGEGRLVFVKVLSRYDETVLSNRRHWFALFATAYWRRIEAVARKARKAKERAPQSECDVGELPVELRRPDGSVLRSRTMTDTEMVRSLGMESEHAAVVAARLFGKNAPERRKRFDGDMETPEAFLRRVARLPADADVGDLVATFSR